MENKNKSAILETCISLEAGRVDAMLAALVGVLRATRDNPEVSSCVLRALTDAYPRKGPRAENKEFVDGFGKAADHILGALHRM